MALLRANAAAWQTGGVAHTELWQFDLAQCYAIRADTGGAYTLAGSVSVGNAAAETWTWAVPVIYNVASGATLNLGTALPIAGTGTWAGLQTFSVGLVVGGGVEPGIELLDGASIILDSGATITAESGSTITLASGATLTIATGATVALGAAIAISGTATWAQRQTFTVGINAASIQKGGAEIKGLVSTASMAQSSDTPPQITSTSYVDVQDTALSLGTLVADDTVIIDLNPLSCAENSGGTGYVAVVFVDDGDESTLAEMLVGDVSTNVSQQLVTTVVNGGACSIKLQAKTAGSYYMQISTQELAMLWRAQVFR